ncbi:hypothetical protein P885DRAFT_81630 [Corynascus similis CBS 632.67]
MSDLFEAIKDAINPKRREQATVETYDPHTRGPYPDRSSTGEASGQSQPQAQPQQAEANDAARAERTGLSNTATGAIEGSNQVPRRVSGAGYGAPQGTYGAHKSRVANVLDPRVDSDTDGTPSHGINGYGGAATKPLHTEGSKYGLT